MTITLTQNMVYLVICGLLLILQVYQQYSINKIKSEIDTIWSQIGLFVAATSAKITEVENKIKDNEKTK